MDIGRLFDSMIGPDRVAQVKAQAGSAIQGAKTSATTGGWTEGRLGGFAGGAAAGAAGGGLLAAMMGSKKVRKVGKNVAIAGGAAALAGLAYKAYSDWQGSKAATGTPPATPEAFDPSMQRDDSGRDFRLALIQAMIAAAKADGHVDDAENATIRQAIDRAELQPDEKMVLFDAFSAPADPLAIAALATSPEQKSELYLASLLAIDLDEPSERRYLDRLAGALALPDGLIAQLETKAAEVAR